MRDSELKVRLRTHSQNMKNSIDSPFDITKKIDETENGIMTKKNLSFNWLKNMAYTAAAVAAAFVLTVNCIPSLAYAASDIPVLGDVVRVVTFGRFEVQKENFEAKVVTPKIEGLMDKELENKLNKELSDNANTVIAAFENDIEEMSKEYGDKNFHLAINADYEVKTDNDNILAVDFHITRTEASATTTHRFYNINKKTGEIISLESMFDEEIDYVTPISNYIISEMKAQNDNGTGYYFIEEDDMNKFVKIEKDQNFYINAAGNIVICFDEYEVAAGAQGSPEFVIPNDVIKGIVK